MPFNRRQLHNITKSRGQAFIARNRGNYALRVAESYIRRKLYSYEDRTITQEYRIFQQAWSEIRASVFLIGENINSAWRRRFLEYLEPRLYRLAAQVAQHTLQRSTTAYLAGYYGRLWVLDSATVEGTPLNLTRPQSIPMDEGQVAELYENAAMATVQKIRSELTAAVNAEESIPQALSRVSVALGMNKRNPRGMWYKSQLVTRYMVMRLSNHGALNAFKAQVGYLREAEPKFTSVIVALEWLSSRDSRVCDYCRSMDGTTWPVDELSSLEVVGLPPDDSHPGCRCTITANVHDEFAKPDNQPPDNTFAEWLVKNGYDVFPEFIDSTSLDSTQV